MAEKVSDVNGFGREQQSRITAAAAGGMNVLRPIMHFQVSLLRMWADSIERLAGNYEKGLSDASNAVKDKDRAA
jgi:hypothetical protein